MHLQTVVLMCIRVKFTVLMIVTVCLASGTVRMLMTLSEYNWHDLNRDYVG